MRMTTLQTLLVLLVVALPASAMSAGTMDGTVKVGGIIMNDAGDRTAVQETYNVFDGFSISEFRLNGSPIASDRFTLDLRDINLDSRSGDFVYRRPGLFKVTAGYDQNRQLFSPDGGVNADRKDWKFGAQVTPLDWLRVSGNVNYLTREGDRLAFPSGTTGAPGTRYDNALKSGEVSAAVNRNRYGGAMTFRLSDYNDELDAAFDRRGQVMSARLHGPCILYDKWTHLVRGAYGTSELSNADLEYTFSSFAYTGVVAPVDAFQFRYNFDASRVEDDAADFRTDRVQNNFDATWFHPFGQVSGGYGYETNDDDDALTHYHGWRAGTVLRYGKYVTARVDYAGRNKTDLEELTLLKDVESSRFRGKLQVQPVEALTLGGGYTRREREFPDIRVEVEGDAAHGFARYTYAGWGAISAHYNYADDTYEDLVAGFDSRSDIVTGRVDFERIKDLRLAGGMTYLDIGGDLDIEKSMVFAEGVYTLQNNYHIEVKYNVYNYDDYILLDRYYTANVLRINVGYDFDLK